MWWRKLLELEAQLAQPNNQGAGMPAGIRHAYAFQVCNTISNASVVGMPMLLFFKHFAASAAILGVVLALPPLLNILQVPAAPVVDKVGYRPFVLRGWTIQCFIILGMGVVALLPGPLARPTRLAWMLVLLFVYNAARGFFTCGFMPWMTQLIPASRRGRYVSLDQMSSQFASLVTMVGTAWFVKHAAGRTAFGQIFVGGCGAGLVSLWFLARIPNAAVPAPSRITGPVP